MAHSIRPSKSLFVLIFSGLFAVILSSVFHSLVLGRHERPILWLGKRMEAIGRFPIEPLGAGRSLILALGSSEFELAVVPSAIDACLKEKAGVESTTYNLAARALELDMQILLARKLERNLAAKSQRAEISIVQVSLDDFLQFNLTRTRYSSFYNDFILGPDMAESGEPRTPFVWLRYKFLRLLFQGLSPELTGNLLKRKLGEIVSPSENPGAAYASLKRFVAPEPWSLDARGAFQSAPKEELERFNQIEAFLQTSEGKQIALDYWGAQGLRELQFSDSRIADFLTYVDLLKKFSNHIIFVLAPHSPIWPNRERRIERVQHLATKLERAASISIVNYFSSPEFKEDTFGDTIHLNQQGRTLFSKKICEPLAELLKNRPM